MCRIGAQPSSLRQPTDGGCCPARTSTTSAGSLGASRSRKPASSSVSNSYASISTTVLVAGAGSASSRWASRSPSASKAGGRSRASIGMQVAPRSSASVRNLRSSVRLADPGGTVDDHQGCVVTGVDDGRELVQLALATDEHPSSGLPEPVRQRSCHGNAPGSVGCCSHLPAARPPVQARRPWCRCRGLPRRCCPPTPAAARSGRPGCVTSRCPTAARAVVPPGCGCSRRSRRARAPPVGSASGTPSRPGPGRCPAVVRRPPRPGRGPVPPRAGRTRCSRAASLVTERTRSTARRCAIVVIQPSTLPRVGS